MSASHIHGKPIVITDPKPGDTLVYDAKGRWVNAPAEAPIVLEHQPTVSSSYDESRDPSTADDSRQGFGHGSRWWNAVSRRLFECADAEPGRASWVLIGTIPEREYALRSHAHGDYARREHNHPHDHDAVDAKSPGFATPQMLRKINTVEERADVTTTARVIRALSELPQGMLCRTGDGIESVQLDPPLRLPGKGWKPTEVYVGKHLAPAEFSGAAAPAEHSHVIPVGKPVEIGTENHRGTSHTAAASDHVHAHGCLSGGDMHAVATEKTAGFMGPEHVRDLRRAYAVVSSSGQVCSPSSLLSWHHAACKGFVLGGDDTSTALIYRGTVPRRFAVHVHAFAETDEITRLGLAVGTGPTDEIRLRRFSGESYALNHLVLLPGESVVVGLALEVVSGSVPPWILGVTAHVMELGDA